MGPVHWSLVIDHWSLVIGIVTIYLVIPLLAAIAIVQATVSPHLAVWGVFPDLPLLVVIGWGLLRGPRDGAIWGFIAGLAVDLLSGAPFGAATLPLIAVGFLSGLGQASVFTAHAALPMLAMFLATIAYDLLFLLVVRISGLEVMWLDTLVRLILPSAVLNAVLMPVVFWGLRKLSTWFSHEEMEW
jgi:rod shape-determining protein MreD